MTYITVGTGSVYSQLLSTCNSGVIFPICQMSVSHHHGLTVLFPKKVLSPSQSLTYVFILYCILKKVKNKMFTLASIFNSSAFHHLIKLKPFIYRCEIIFNNSMWRYCHTYIIFIVTKVNILTAINKSDYRSEWIGGIRYHNRSLSVCH